MQLYNASLSGDTSEACRLLDAGADVQATTDTGATPLYTASQ